MNSPSQETPGDNDALPENVHAALRRRYGTVPDISRNLDQVILADAQRYLKEMKDEVTGTRRNRTGRWTGFRSGLMAASTLVAASAVVILWSSNRWSSSPESRQAASRDAGDAELNHISSARGVNVNDLQRDVDRSGRVDILDAFAVARSIRHADSAEHDLNGDGRVDQSDIDLVARDAVRL